MATGWMCTCGHNRSVHRHDWNGFRGEWFTGCGHVDTSRPGGRRCQCNAFTSADAVETRQFDPDDYPRGYMCVAPDRVCGVQRTVTAHGMWFKSDGGQLWQSAHKGCLQATKEEKSACG